MKSKQFLSSGLLAYHLLYLQKFELIKAVREMEIIPILIMLIHHPFTFFLHHYFMLKSPFLFSCLYFFLFKLEDNYGIKFKQYKRVKSEKQKFLLTSLYIFFSFPQRHPLLTRFLKIWEGNFLCPCISFT